MRNLILTIAVLFFITFLLGIAYLIFTAFFKNEVSAYLFKINIILFTAFIVAGYIRDKMKR